MASLKTGDGERLAREKFKALLAKPWYMTLLVVLPCAAMVFFAYRQNAPIAIAAPLVIAAGILLFGHSWASAQARRQVLQTFAAKHGLLLHESPDCPTWTPLLRTGDERRMDTALTGTVNGMAVYIGHYTYTEISQSTDSKGNTRTDRTDYDFTVACTDVGTAVDVLPTLYLKPDTGLFDVGDGWLDTGGMTRCQTESVRFNKRYKGWHRPEQDLIALKRLLDPSTIEALSDHPLHFGVEMAGGRLLIYVEDHCADSGELTALLDGLAWMRNLVLEAARVVSEPAPASHAPPAG